MTKDGDQYMIDKFKSDKLEQCLELAANSAGDVTLAEFEGKCRSILIGPDQGMLIASEDKIMGGVHGSVLDCVHTDLGNK